MPYFVKATGRTGYACWLSATNEAGFRTLAPREDADVFPTAKDAHGAIAILPRAFDDAGLIFSVHPAD